MTIQAMILYAHRAADNIPAGFTAVSTCTFAPPKWIHVDKREIFFLFIVVWNNPNPVNRLPNMAPGRLEDARVCTCTYM